MPVKKHLKKYAAFYQDDTEYKRQIDNLARVVKSDEWQFVVQTLWGIKNEMAIELLQSSKFTKGEKESKDITQRTYHNIAELIDFLVDPRKWIQKKGRLQILTSKFKGDKPERKKHG